jgi:hypothetical protein
MKKSILVATVLAFALMNAGPASAVRDKDKDAKDVQTKTDVQSKAGVQSKTDVQSKTGVQSKAGVQSKTDVQSKAGAVSGAQANKAKSTMAE